MFPVRILIRCNASSTALLLYVASNSEKRFIRAQIELSSTFVYDYKMSTGSSSRREIRTSPMGGGGRGRGELQ